MWPFTSKQTLESSGVFKGLVDYHSHILPGVDDGIQTMEESIKTLKFYETLGVEQVWCTPHIMEDIPNTPAELKTVFDALVKEYDGPIALHLAAEHMMDSLFEERLEKNEVLPICASGDRLLVETSYFNPPVNMDKILRSIRSAGYFPVLAHPERYYYMTQKDYTRLRADGVEFQLNLLSLTDAYGRNVRKKAEWLFENNYYFYRGTDIHSLRSMQSRLDQKIDVKFLDI